MEITFLTVVCIGNTCYKLTEPSSWRGARRQCWRWGGELAFPLDPASDECSTRIFSNSQEEVHDMCRFPDVETNSIILFCVKIWMASTDPCPASADNDNADDTSRCVVSFADTKARSKKYNFLSMYNDTQNELF